MSDPIVGSPDIAFIGQPGCGKSTAARFLAEYNGYLHWPIGNEIRQIAIQLWGPTAWNDREKLQFLGDTLRQHDPDVWLNLATERLTQSRVPQMNQSGTQIWRPVANDDIRYENEYDALKARGFVIVRVKAPYDQCVARLTASGKFQNEEQLARPMEHHLDDAKADHIITNDDNVMDLYEQVHSVIWKELRKR